MDTCGAEYSNVAYSEETFKLISRLASLITKYRQSYGVPPIAVAGSIGDEYNTRKGFRTVVDWFQDDVLLNFMPNAFIKIDVYVGANSKWLNSTKHDIGKGNIKLETARNIYMRYRDKFSGDLTDWSVLVDFIRSDEGTVQIAALVIKRAQEVLGSYIAPYTDDVREAVLVTYYKQGDAYVQRFLQKKAGEVGEAVTFIRPGEGCRVMVQRQRFKTALGIVP